jgi:predicted dehydrogenase
LCPHLIDQAVVLFGEPQRVSARIATHRPGGPLHDFVRLSLHYDSGVDATLEVDQLDAFGGRRLALRGALGCFDKQGFDPQEAELSAGRFPDTPDWGKEPEPAWGTLRVRDGDELQEERIETLPGDHRLFYRAAHDAIVSRRASPVSLGDVLCQIRIIEAALRSAESGRIVSL